MRLAAADTVVFLDLPTHVCIWRIIDRALNPRAGTSGHRPDMAEGCAEKLDPPFIEWVYNYRERSRPKLLAMLAEVEDEKVIHTFTSSRAADRWVRELASG